MPSAPDLGRFYFWEQRAAYLGPGLPESLHSHHAVQVFVGLSGPVRLRSGPGARWEEHGGAVVRADEPHESDVASGSFATLWLAPGSSYARALSRARVPAIRPIPAERLAEITKLLRGCSAEHGDATGAARQIDEVLRILALVGGAADHIDPRVARARELLAGAPGRRISWREVAARVSLSVGRMAHLFGAQAGRSRRYLQWLRLSDAMGRLAAGASITEAAHAAGFADGAHFTRTLRAMLGLTPSAALRGSKIVQDSSRPTA